MKTKDIYKENKERKYCQIVDIKKIGKNKYTILEMYTG